MLAPASVGERKLRHPQFKQYSPFSLTVEEEHPFPSRTFSSALKQRRPPDKHFDNDHSMRDDFTQTETQGAAAKPADAAEPSPRALFWTVFPSVMLPMFLAVADQTIVATALPAITADLGGVERISWVVVSYLIANTIAAPVYGRLGELVRPAADDLHGARAVHGRLGAVRAVADHQLADRRARMQGLGGGGLMTLSQALIGETIPPRERGRYQGYLAGVMVAQAPSARSRAATSPRPSAGARSSSSISRSDLARRPPRAAPRGAPRRLARMTFDAPGLVLFTLFVSPVILALEQVQHMDAGTLPLIAGLLAFGALALLALIWQEKHSTSPLIPPALFREPSVWRADAMTACHGAALVSSITFLPIYLRAVRGASPAETGLLMLPLMFGIGIGSLVTGQLVTRTGRTAAFPSYGLVAATLGLLFLALSLPHLSLFELPWVFGAIACFMGTVMGVVQVTVQAVAGQRMLGTGAAMVQFSRSVGAAFGTAIVAAVLFSTIAARDPETARLFGAMIDHGPEAIAALTPARQAAVQSDIGEAFRAVFGTIAAFTGIGALLAFSMPLRKV